MGIAKSTQRVARVIQDEELEIIHNGHFFPSKSSIKKLDWEISLGPYFSAVPNEIFLYILQYLTLKELLVISSVSKALIILASDQALWKEFYFHVKWHHHNISDLNQMKKDPKSKRGIRGSNIKNMCCWKREFTKNYFEPTEIAARRRSQEEEARIMRERIYKQRMKKLKELKAAREAEENKASKKLKKKVIFLNEQTRKWSSIIVIAVVGVPSVFGLFWWICGIPYFIFSSLLQPHTCQQSFLCTLFWFLDWFLFVTNSLFYYIAIVLLWPASYVFIWNNLAKLPPFDKRPHDRIYSQEMAKIREKYNPEITELEKEVHPRKPVQNSYPFFHLLGNIFKGLGLKI